MKKWGKEKWLAVLLLGLLLLVTAIPAKKPASQTASETVESSARSGYGSSYGSTNAAARTLSEKAALEQQLEELLLQVEGIGQVRVMLMLKDLSDSVTSFSSQNPSISIQGVLIVAQGGDNSVTVRNIQEAVMALFQVEAHKIKVMKMK